MRSNEQHTDFETYQAIMHELQRPIDANASPELDADTLKRLYQSKLVYLENLRIQCFRQMNRHREESYFRKTDYELIVNAISDTHCHLRELVLNTLRNSLAAR